MEQRTVEVYHEKQRGALCGLHALNNLFQDKNAFTEKALDRIAVGLKQRGFLSSFHIGNYEISVLQVAVKTKGCQLIQFDKRKVTVKAMGTTRPDQTIKEIISMALNEMSQLAFSLKPNTGPNTEYIFKEFHLFQ
ncbi:josephin-1 isoform X3 [Octopus bimaculoides]|uniref:josephin-1 isoform X3 n=1 Tax=Octopus bimaculoides TaxID=37653 RepID=UPI00071E1B24|nr:josephin-1 isoform X3 [Octopus bimaculoides]|eukprot:XP_014776702.1 PREDICTED: josephin-1-like isoform X3 [Octopus bimaculoides]